MCLLWIFVQRAHHHSKTCHGKARQLCSAIRTVCLADSVQAIEVKVADVAAHAALTAPALRASVRCRYTVLFSIYRQVHIYLQDCFDLLCFAFFYNLIFPPKDLTKGSMVSVVHYSEGSILATLHLGCSVPRSSGLHLHNGSNFLNSFLIAITHLRLQSLTVFKTTSWACKVLGLGLNNRTHLRWSEGHDPIFLDVWLIVPQLETWFG